MANFCLPKELTSKFLGALKSGDINLEKVFDMSSENRRAEFAKVVGDQNAREINASFEQKKLHSENRYDALVQKMKEQGIDSLTDAQKSTLKKAQEQGIITWAKSVGGLKPDAMRDLVTRLSKLDSLMSPKDEESFLSDLLAKKLGTNVSFDQLKTLNDLTKKANAEREKNTGTFGVSDDYLLAANKLRDYITSLKPATPLQSIGKNLGTIGRNNLLFNPSTFIKTTIGQTTNSIVDAITRRIATLSLTGAARDLAVKMNAEAYKSFLKTGLNVASMESLDDVGKLGEGKNFEVANAMKNERPIVRATEAAVRKTAQLSNKVVIDWEHNLTFTKFYQKTFYDALNIFSTETANGDKVRAQTIMKDAALIKPKTSEGQVVRQRAQAQAARITSTNPTWMSSMSLSLKNWLNKQLPGLGDAIVPIAKIPANIIVNGLDNAGWGAPFAVKDIAAGIKKIGSGDVGLKYEGMAQLAVGIQRMVRIAGALTTAAYFTSQLNKKDFYTDSFGTHFVKIGNWWVNTEYFSLISPALSGMMTVKQKYKSGQDIVQTIGQYSAGSLGDLRHAPGLTDLNDLVTSAVNTNAYKGAGKYIENFFTDRGIPAFARPTLTGGPRPLQQLLVGKSGAETVQQKKQDAAASARARRKP